MYTVYWIKHSEHTDVYQDGYVGISASVHTRWNQHKLNPPNEHFKNAIQKYGWDNLVKQVIFTGSKEACLAFETSLRPTKKIGWNLEIGGGLPPKHYGIENFNVINKGEKHPLFGKRRKDLSERLLKNHHMHDPKVVAKYVGSKNGKFKGSILAVDLKTKLATVLTGNIEVINAGFTQSAVSECVNGKRKQHKGHTFTRIIKE